MPSMKKFFLLSNLHLTVLQPEVMFPCLVPSCLVEEADSHLAAISFQLVVESDKTPLSLLI